MSQISALQGMRDEIAERLNEVEADNSDKYTNWISLGLNDIQASFPNAPFLQTSADRTLSSGTRIYTNFPADISKINSLIYPAGNIKLTYLEPEQFDILFPSATEGGNPNYYTVRGAGTDSQRFEFEPSPGSSVTVHMDYQKTLSALSAGSAVIGLPNTYLELPVLYAESLGLRRKGARSDAVGVKAEYEALKQRMIENLNRRTTENATLINPRDLMGTNRNYGDKIRNIFNNP